MSTIVKTVEKGSGQLGRHHPQPSKQSVIPPVSGTVRRGGAKSDGGYCLRIYLSLRLVIISAIIKFSQREETERERERERKRQRGAIPAIFFFFLADEPARESTAPLLSLVVGRRGAKSEMC